MAAQDPLVVFQKQVVNKYNLYNSLFLRLPYERIKSIGLLLPILATYGRAELQQSVSPKDIVQSFFTKFTNIKDTQEEIDFLLKIIQYVERQVVLFDSVEDAAFSKLQAVSDEESLESVLQMLIKKEMRHVVIDFLNQFSIRLVFTAHPTQFYPPSVQYILHDLKEAIQDDDVDEIDLILQQLGQTPFYHKQKPSPLDEANSILYYLRYVYYDSIGDLHWQIAQALPEWKSMANGHLFSIGFWPGGDRDGNPYVTHDITMKVASNLKKTILKCYYNELKNLRRRITFKYVSEKLKALSDQLYNSLFDADAINDVNEITAILDDVADRLDKYHNGLMLDEVRKFIVKVATFKLHFATIDIRQDSSIHSEVVNTIRKTTSTNTVDIEAYDGIVKETLLTVSCIRDIQSTNGEQGCNRYIISNTEQAQNVMDVLQLFDWCGYQSEEIKVDIIPLFETIQGLTTCVSTMTELLDNEQYRNHLALRKNIQTIMLGFSDGTKDGGYLKANWEILKAKKALTCLCKTYDVAVIFFDGRGGPPARGGGKTQRFYASQGKDIADKEIQLTIQGQTITSMYGNTDQFIHHCSQLLVAGIHNAFDLKKNVTTWSASQLVLMEALAQAGYEKYTALKEHPQFLPYLENRSTLPYYAMANIGSRPGKRNQDRALRFSDLRAISFVGSWSQLKQNVPGFFGIGTAIEDMKKEGRYDEVKKLYNESSFFKALLLNSMMALEKTFYPLTAYMQQDPIYAPFWQILYDEYLLTKNHLLDMSDQAYLMEEEALSKASINIREEIVLPLLIIQQYALQIINENPAHKTEYEKLVTRSLFGNINASRNSA